MSTRTLLFTDCVDFVGSACKPFAGMKKYVSTGAVDVDHINDSDTEIVDYDGKPSRANLEVMAGDVLFAKMQGTKKTLLIDSVLAKHIYSTGFCAVRAKKGILTERCLYHILTSEMFLSQKDKNCSGATQKAITNAGLGKVVIHVPSVEEQNIIADQLDAVICIITKRQQELSALDILIKARFVEMFGDPVLNPFGWEEKNVIDECDCMVPGRDKPKSFTGDIPWITIEDLIVNGVTYNSKSGLGLTQEEIDSVNRKTIPVGSVIMSCVGNLGICSIAGRDMIINQQLHSFQCGENINNVFLMYYLGYRKDYMNKWASNTTVLYMNKTICNSIPIIIPPIGAQNRFVDFVAQVDKSKSAVLKSLEKTQILFDSLMQQYFG